LAPQSHDRIAWVLETEMNLFPWEMYHHTDTYHTYKAGDRCAHQVPLIITPASQPLLLHSLLTAPHHPLPQDVK
jgi:hypothetical protein